MDSPSESKFALLHSIIFLITDKLIEIFAEHARAPPALTIFSSAPPLLAIRKVPRVNRTFVARNYGASGVSSAQLLEKMFEMFVIAEIKEEDGLIFLAGANSLQLYTCILDKCVLRSFIVNESEVTYLEIVDSEFDLSIPGKSPIRPVGCFVENVFSTCMNPDRFFVIHSLSEIAGDMWKTGIKTITAR